MPKSDFISDKLIDMSDHFKRDYAERHHLPLPEGLRQEVDTAAPTREMRDFTERLTRDTAAVQKEREELEMRRGELERFLALAQKVQTRCTETSDPGELSKLRIEYFGALGRVSTAAPAVTAPTASNGDELRPWREIFRRSLPTAAAIILAALIVTVTLIILLA